jgi:hypothetical protein
MKEDKEKTPSPWAILEMSILLEAEDFQRYCDTHPEEAEQAKKMILEKHG